MACRESFQLFGPEEDASPCTRPKTWGSETLIEHLLCARHHANTAGFKRSNEALSAIKTSLELLLSKDCLTRFGNEEILMTLGHSPGSAQVIRR